MLAEVQDSARTRGTLVTLHRAAAKKLASPADKPGMAREVRSISQLTMYSYGAFCTELKLAKQLLVHRCWVRKNASRGCSCEKLVGLLKLGRIRSAAKGTSCFMTDLWTELGITASPGGLMVLSEAHPVSSAPGQNQVRKATA